MAERFKCYICHEKSCVCFVAIGKCDECGKYSFRMKNYGDCSHCDKSQSLEDMATAYSKILQKQISGLYKCFICHEKICVCNIARAKCVKCGKCSSQMKDRDICPHCNTWRLSKLPIKKVCKFRWSCKY